MRLIDAIYGVPKKVLGILLLIIGLYTAFHFAHSGIELPFSFLKDPYSSAMGQIKEETIPLMDNIDDISKITITNPRQYGPVLFFVAYPILMIFNNNILALEIFATTFAYICTALSFYFTYKLFGCRLDSLKKKYKHINYLFVALMAIIWFNFSQLYYILATKNVESWELLMVIGAFYAYQKNKMVFSGILIGTATMTKFLPGIFLLYFLFKDRRVFYSAASTIILILLFATAAFNYDVGFGSVARIVNQGGQNSWAIMHFENVALKSLIYKSFGGFYLENKNDVFFWIDEKYGLFAYVVSLLAQIAGGVFVSFLGYNSNEKNLHEKNWLEFSIVLAIMLVISPAAAPEYATLLLFAYSAALYFLLFTKFNYSDTAMYVVSIILVGIMIPTRIFMKVIPIDFLNAHLGNIGTMLNEIEMYKGYGFPGYGMILLLILLIIQYYRMSLLPNPNIGAS